MTNPKELLQYTQNLKLLFAEDHKELRESTVEILNNFFGEVNAVNDGKEALKLYNTRDYDILLTDIRMPNINGVELTRKIYDINPEQKVIILSAHDESKYLIPLINLGVSQFVKKPIDYQELMTALLKVSKSLQNKKTEPKEKSYEKIEFEEEYTYDRENRLLTQANRSIYLTKYEIIFLNLLTSQSGKIFSNEDIVNYYYQQNEKMDPQNIRKLVSKLRKKMPPNAIESIYGVGYRVITLN